MLRKEGAWALSLLAGDLEERKKTACLYNQILIDAGKSQVVKDRGRARGQDACFTI